MTVFRPRRRCGRCGLVNADGAHRCRRCGGSFAGVDPAAESERLVARIRTRRTIVAVVAVLLVAGLAGAGYWYQSWNERLGLFDERAHAVRTDLVTLTRGARSDATLISRAFDDADVRSLLRDQADMWADRLKKCDQLHDKLEELIPLNASQTAHEMAIERELAEIQSAARDLSNAAANEDVFTARVAATRLADSNSSGTASE